MNIICSFCHNVFRTKMFKVHLKKSHKQEFKNASDMDLYTLKIRYCLTDDTIKSIITDYSTMSVLDLKSKYHLSYRAIQTLLSAMSVPVRGLSNAALMPSVRTKSKQSCLTRYGVDNPSKHEGVKSKKAKTFCDHFGVSNIFKSDVFKSQIDGIMLQRYGVKRVVNKDAISKSRLSFSKDKLESIQTKRRNTVSSWNTEKGLAYSKVRSDLAKEQWQQLSDMAKKEKVAKMLHNLSKNGYHSALEKRVREVIDSWDIEYTYQFWLSGTYYDFRIGNLIIEVNGDYWHANPNRYDADDLLIRPNGKSILASTVWERDRKKQARAEQSGYHVIYLWECDLNKMEFEEIDRTLLEKVQEHAYNDD